MCSWRSTRAARACLVVAVEHRHGSLDDDRAVVERRRDEMHRAAMDAYAFVSARWCVCRPGKDGSSEGGCSSGGLRNGARNLR